MIDNKLKINLQLFADESVNEEVADPINNPEDVAIENNTEVETEPVIDSKAQSRNKDNPANSLFAKMRREKKELETNLQRYKQIDAYYADLAKKSGLSNITNAIEYAEAIKNQTFAEQYKETGDPSLLIDRMKESIFSDPRFSQIIQPQSSGEDVIDKELSEFNSAGYEKLESFDDILNLPNSQKILTYMDTNNLPLLDAYKLANAETLVQKQTKAAKQAAINQAKGHTHINSNAKSGGIEEIPVSENDIAIWKRRHGSNKTDEQCRKEITEAKKLLL